ncbi:dihydroorotase [Falsiroseomonas selenitidurans]|uniref:Dihydroorotase family protein n=1 Tax=Falsiroseomonas selenitidurans TaxID=2716335 RepID=A0ABX1E6R1_9PROT|nr:dihydroorotase family protein [Falsiroseomonas selenitidurans]NKC31467.1 dihydroorotase family protein [Falsiroseomonas selenitidurans]
MEDLLVHGGRIATTDGLREATLVVRRGHVAAWLEPGATPRADSVVDATGLVVLPGLVDAHVHFRDPGLTHKEDFTSGSAAAAAGGVTTALVMPTDLPPTFSADGLAAKAALAAGRLHIDVGLQGAAVEPGQVAALAAAGATSIEVFLGDMPAALLARDLVPILAACRAAGIVAGITPADDAVIAQAEAQWRRPGADALDFYRSRPPESEARGTARAIAAARETGAAIHLRQVSCGESLALLRAARAGGLDITAETTPHYLLLDEEEIRRQGPWAKILPPLRGAADRAALWQAVADGTVDMVATDHAPHAPAEKLPGEADIWAAPGGFPGVQTLLPLMLGAVAEGRIGWGDLVRLCGAAPAARFGLKHKGSLAPGAEADFVLVDPTRAAVIRNQDQRSRAGRTPFDGWRVTGWPVATYLRGACIMREDAVMDARAGRVLRR